MRSVEGAAVLVTGATDGLGLEVAAVLAEAGAHVLVHGRDPVNNAGIGSGPPGAGRQTSANGYELRFQVNYLAAFLLTRLLLPLLRAFAPARVVNVASGAQQPIDFDDVMLEDDYDGWRAYSQSKLAEQLEASQLAMVADTFEVTVNSRHPAARSSCASSPIRS